MKLKNNIYPSGLLTLVFIFLLSMTLPDTMDYLSLGKQLTFNGEKYDLKWSSHPSANYYKQEYLKQGEELRNYHNMLLVEALEGSLKINDVVQTKTADLDARKKWDFVANYNVYENEKKPSEAIIDFVVSDTMTTYEWNLYRYQKQKDKIILFAYSYRDSLNDDNDLKLFFGRIKEKRNELINKLQSYSIPEVSIRN